MCLFLLAFNFLVGVVSGVSVEIFSSFSVADFKMLAA
jgi:hypothetical protein